jgi:hypothetical protein
MYDRFKRPAIRTELEFITPSKAAEYLALNRNNRTLSQNKVLKHARDMRCNDFPTTHQGIAFHENGNLCDGQHRLAAIIEANTPVWMNVSRNLTDAAVMHIDGDIRARQAHECLSMSASHADASKQEVAAARQWVSLLQPSLQLTLSDVASFLDRHRDAISHSVEVARGNLQLRHACVLAVIAISAEHGHAQDSADWADVFRSGIACKPWDSSVIRFRDFWMTCKRSGGATHRKEYCERIYASLSAFIERRPLSKIYARRIEWLDSYIDEVNAIGATL